MGTNVPREKITWFPTIDYDACLGDRLCYDFCHNDVFVWDEENQHPIVQNPIELRGGLRELRAALSVGSHQVPQQRRAASDASAPARRGEKRSGCSTCPG